MSQSSLICTQASPCFSDDIELPKNAILLATVLASLPRRKQIFTIEDLIQSKTAPTRETINEIVSELHNNGFIKETRRTCDDLVQYRINRVNNDKELQTLIRKIEKDSSTISSPVHKLLKITLISECLEFINTISNLRSTKAAKESECFDKLTNILEASPLSVAQMYLWRATQNVSQSDLRLAMASNEKSNLNTYIIEQAHNYYTQQQNYGREHKKFRRQPDYQESVLSKVLFRYHLKMPNYYNTFLIPT